MNSRQERDERGLILFGRMLSRHPVWVDSPAGQMTWIQMVGLDDRGEMIAYDVDGNDRLCEDYLLADPKRSGGTIAERHADHYRHCNCLANSAICCVESCPCHVETA